ncbi:MAG: ABC transporter permease subunit [Bdellovibrionota bacterium]
MIRLIWVNTQEWFRLKFFQIVLFLSFLFVCFSQLLGSLSFTEQQRLVVDFGLAGIEIALIFIACFFSTHSLAKEIERKTILVVLSRPIARWKILIGFFGSLAILNLIAVIVLSATLYFFITSPGGLFNLNYVLAIAIIYIKSMVIGSIGLCISVMARPMFAFVLTITMWLMSYSIVEVQFFMEKAQVENSKQIFAVISTVFPQFYKFNWKSYGFLKALINPYDVGWALLHSAGWILLSLYIAAMLFRKKEIV